MDVIIRKLEKNDFHLGYLNILNQLSEFNIEEINYQMFEKYINLLDSNINIFIIYDNTNNTIIGTGTIIIEKKIIHNFGKVGHIEDIVIDNKYRGKGFGKLIVDYLINYAKTNNCYKVILVSSDKNIEFYQKNKFIKKDNLLTLYF
jgi:glucosamine-phosphate N-acetyltransferase